MFEKLDQVDWSALRDAYGPAVKTPKRIRALASPNKGKREKALDDLSYTIYHQGTIYDSSLAAVPFLLEIVESPEVEDRTQALELLQALSTGSSFHEAHAGLFFNREKSKTAEWQEKVREEKSWVAAIHEWLSAAVPLIVRVLQKGNASERLGSVSLLATLQDNRAAVDALTAAALDPEPSLSAAAISAVGSQDEAKVEILERCFEGTRNELVRTVAAMQLLNHRGKDAPSAAVEHLLKHLRSPQPEIRKAYEALPDVGAFLGDLGKAVACGPTAAGQEAFPLLYEEVKRSPHRLEYTENFGVLILATMLNPPLERDWSKITLTPQQRQAIRLVADRAWEIDGGRRSINLNLAELLESVGLPGDREKVVALLAGTPEGEQTPKEREQWSSKPKKKRPWWKLFLLLGIPLLLATVVASR
jgi:hypothetical protein